MGVQHLFAAHHEGVFRYLCRIVGRGEASDLTQEVFLRVSRGPVPRANDQAQRAWVFRIARNLALNHLRDGRRQPATVELSDPSRPATQETATAIHQALLALSVTDRDVFLLREAAGLSYEEIALTCEISGDAVRSRLHRARQLLRASLCPPVAASAEIQVVRLYDKS